MDNDKIAGILLDKATDSFGTTKLALEAGAAIVKAKAKINTSYRLFNLVRYMRSELHEADLITDEEYAWLSGEAPMATCPEGGSPSPRRLEDYDDVSARSKEMALLLAERLIQIRDSWCLASDTDMACERAAGDAELKERLEKLGIKQ